MGRVALFIGGLVVKLSIWLIATVSFLVFLVVGYLLAVFLYIDDSDETFFRLAESELLKELDDPSTDCSTLIRDINIAADANLPRALLVMESYDQERRCGDWPDLGPDTLNWARRSQEFQRNGLEMQMRESHTRLAREVLGSAGSREYWRRHHSLTMRCELNPYWVNRELIEERLANPDLTARDSRQIFYEFWYQCGVDLVELANYGLAMDHYTVRASANWLMNTAKRTNNADAIWWDQIEFWELEPDFFGDAFVLLETQTVPTPDPPVCVDDPERREFYRFMAGLGHEEATWHWLAQGIPVPDQGLPACLDAVNHYFDRDWFGEPVAWRGGYDTPFWHAVHAIRTGDDMAQAHMQAIEADIGSDCMAMARILAGHLENVLPGPPQDIPAARQMIAESIVCQPEGMRDPAVYPGAVYEPVETLAFSSIEPRFVPTPVSETISTPD